MGQGLALLPLLLPLRVDAGCCSKTDSDSDSDSEFDSLPENQRTERNSRNSSCRLDQGSKNHRCFDHCSEQSCCSEAATRVEISATVGHDRSSCLSCSKMMTNCCLTILVRPIVPPAFLLKDLVERCWKTRLTFEKYEYERSLKPLLSSKSQAI